MKELIQHLEETTQQLKAIATGTADANLANTTRQKLNQIMYGLEEWRGQVTRLTQTIEHVLTNVNAIKASCEGNRASLQRLVRTADEVIRTAYQVQNALVARQGAMQHATGDIHEVHSGTGEQN